MRKRKNCSCYPSVRNTPQLSRTRTKPGKSTPCDEPPLRGANHQLLGRHQLPKPGPLRLAEPNQWVHRWQQPECFFLVDETGKLLHRESLLCHVPHNRHRLVVVVTQVTGCDSAAREE